MKNKLFILICFLFVCSYSDAQDLIKDARNGLINEIKNNKANNIYYEVENLRSSFQTSTDLFTINTNLTKNNRTKEFVNDAVLFDIKKERLSEIVSNKPISISLEIPINTAEPVILDLIQVDPLSPNFKVMTSSGKEYGRDDFTTVFYRGIVRNDPSSLVAISFFEDKLKGLIADKGGNYVLALTDAKENDSSYVLYNDKQLKTVNDFTCGGAIEDPSRNDQNDRNDGSTKNFENDCVGIYFECTFDFFEEEGSADGVFEFVAALMNVVGILFENEDIPLNLAMVFIWDEEDMYADIENGHDVLDEFEAHHNDFSLGKLFQFLSPEADLAYLATRRRFPDVGGVAHLDELCGGSPYGLSGGVDFIGTFPNFSHDVEVVGHELGHLFGSRHTHECVWNGNDTQIDDCGNLYFLDQGDDTPDCFDENNPILPINGSGTIMSYCDTSFPGSGSVSRDFTAGFGPQPGALMRANYNSSNCLIPCGSSNCPIFLNLTETNPGILTGADRFTASAQLTATNTIADGALIAYGGGERIELLPGFSAELGSTFICVIDECGISARGANFTDNPDENNPYYRAIKSKELGLSNVGNSLLVYPNPTTANVTIEFSLIDADFVTLSIFDFTGNVVGLISENQYMNEGNYKEIVNTEKLATGVYFIKLTTQNQKDIVYKLAKIK